MLCVKNTGNKMTITRIIIASLIFRLVLGFTLDFGVDESYMLAQASRFQWSYVDHPPLHVWVAGIMLDVFGVSKLVRLPFILSFSLTTLMLYRITQKLYDEKAALWAAAALNLSAFYLVSPGLMVVPDGLLILFLALATHEFLKATNTSFLLFGLYLGLAGLSKYHAAIFSFSLLIYVVFYARNLLKNPYLWLGGIIALALQTPVIIWNMQNEWVSFAFQAERGGMHGFRPNQFLQMIAGQFFILLPWVAIPLVIACIKMKKPALLLWLALPIIILFTLTPLWGRRGLPHWTMAGWFFLFPILGAWLAPRVSALTWAKGSVAGLLILPLIIIQAKYAFISTKNDPTLEMVGYSNLPPAPDYVIAGSWIEGGKIWVAYKGKVPVFVFGNDQRNFGFNRSMAGLENKRGLYLSTRKREDFKPHFNVVSELPNIHMKRNADDLGITLYHFYISGIKNKITLAPFSK
jgi:4-amino-4-deoxy-L-arabinose transferase-like glycosyltransferase